MIKNNQNISKDIKEGLSIIVPVVNEERNIKTLVERIHAACWSNNLLYEIIFIDDHSNDKTRTVIRALSKKYPNIRSYLKKGKPGKAYSLIEGFSYARHDILAMIDGDLQYPPEAIPDMAEKINDEIGVVVAKRNHEKNRFIRKVLSYGFLFPFVKILHRLNHDVQSGLKVFKKEIIERISLNPGPWSFDLEFLVRAKHAGYNIADHNIFFAKRQDEKAKISLIPATIEIGLSALRLKFTELGPTPFHRHDNRYTEKGFHYKGIRFIPHSKVPLHESAFKTLHISQKLILLNLLLIFIAGLLYDWRATSIVLVGAITLVYFSDLFFNLLLILRNFNQKPELHISHSEILNLNHSDLPVYTILCPLYHEWEVLPQFVTAMSRLDYPKDKLQVLLLLEEDDKETIRHAQNYNLPSYFETVVVPHSLPKTKPKALNYGLKMAKGEFVVVYDAEDIPDPQQLRKVLIAFQKVDKKTVCIQAKLNFYNPHHNILTRIFTAEYSLWFDLVLTGLQSILAPIPLGGTSNHFRLQDLKRLKGWDSFNVTEDCDLGMRLVKHGFRTALINSLTLEEANSDLKNWFQQRTRWIKGYLQTYLVHMREPKAFLKSWREPHLLTFQFIVGGKVLSMFINPLLWITTIAYFAFRPVTGAFIEQFFPAPILYIGVFALVFGNFLYMYYYMIACVKRGHYDLVKYVFLVPFYWLCMSIASWKALVQLINRPHFWPKTIHGFHIDRDRAFTQSFNLRERQMAYQRLIKKINKTKFFIFDLKALIVNLKGNKTWSLKTISSGSFLVASLMMANVLNFIFNAFLGRALSFKDFGLLTLINTFLYVNTIFTSSLVGTVNHRVAFLSAKDGQKAGNEFFNVVLRKSLYLSFIFSIVWILSASAISSYFRVDDLIPILLFTPTISLGFIIAASRGYLQGSFRFFVLGLITISEALGKILIAVAIVILKLNSFAYLPITFTSILSFLLLIAATRKYIHPSQSVEKATYKIFPRKFFIFNCLNALSTTLFLSIDVLLAKHYLLPVEAGQYAFLSLVGKMIFFSGSILNFFIFPFVGRDEGLQQSTKATFNRILSGSAFMSILFFIFVGMLGNITVPILFGAKTSAILPYLRAYALAMTIFTISNVYLIYNMAKRHYYFPVIAVIVSGLLGLGIMLFHSTIGSITKVIMLTSILRLATMMTMHKFSANINFVVRNLTDFLDAFKFRSKIAEPALFKKRILIFNWRDTQHRYAGGAELYIHELAKRWVKSGCKVTLFCGNDGQSLRYEVVDGVEILRRGGFYFVYIWAVLYYLLKFKGKYDVIIDCENGIPFFTPLYAGESVHCLMFHVHQEVFRRSLVRPLAALASFLENRLTPWVYRKNKFITISESSKQEIENLGLAKSGIEIIHPGVDLNQYKPNPKSQTPTIVYIGRLKYYKSLHIFIHTAKQILMKMSKLKINFIIAGDGEEKNNLIRLAKKLSIADKITFLGRVSEEEKIKLYQKAWVSVNPSFMEGWGVTTIEANACATPVVASDVPGLRDSVYNPHNGFLVPYGSIKEFTTKILKLIKDDSLRAKMSIEATYWAQQFDWQKSAEKCLKIISQL